jgi:DNA-binding transcriptional regulator GbsR (MarR family)
MTLSIFLSHHETETELAQNIQAFLETTSGGSISLKTYVQKAEPDSDFRNWINEAAMSSDMFVFLYTDDTRELSWAAHELGMYVATREHLNKPKHVICLQSRDIRKMPEVMSYISPMPATEENIKGLLKDLLLEGAYSEKERLASNSLETEEVLKRINKQAKDLEGMFGSKIHTQYFNDRLIVRNIVRVSLEKFSGGPKPDLQVVRKLRNRTNNEQEEYVLDFANTTIEINENLRTSLGLFDGCNWVDLLSLAADNPADRFDLARGILRHASAQSSNNASENILSEVEVNGKIFRPIISRVEMRDRLPITYYILLIPDNKSRDEEIGKDDNLTQKFEHDIKIVLLLNVARRFRWNLVEPYIWKIRRTVSEGNELGQVLDELMKDLVEIENESAMNKLDNGNLAALDFPEKDRENLANLWLNYYEIRSQLEASVQRRDAKEVLEILIKFQEMNREFMGTGLETYKDLMTQLPTLNETNPDWQQTLFRQDTPVRPQA